MRALAFPVVSLGTLALVLLGLVTVLGWDEVDRTALGLLAVSAFFVIAGAGWLFASRLREASAAAGSSRDVALASLDEEGPGDIAEVIAHEIRQPLAMIRVAAEIAMRGLEADDPRRTPLEEKLGEVEAQSHRIDAILDAMLALGASADGERLPEPPRFDPLAAVEATARMMAPALEADGITLEIEMSGAVQPAAGSQVAFEQVLINLLSNAREAYLAREGPAERPIVIRLARDDAERPMIAVSDRAGGIPGDLLDHLFGAGVSTKPGGHGLGLAICRAILRGMGGGISARNADGGARFEVVLRPAP